MVTCATYGGRYNDWSDGVTRNKAIWVMMHSVPYAVNHFPDWVRCLFVSSNGSSPGWARRL